MSDAPEHSMKPKYRMGQIVTGKRRSSPDGVPRLKLVRGPIQEVWDLNEHPGTPSSTHSYRIGGEWFTELEVVDAMPDGHDTEQLRARVRELAGQRLEHLMSEISEDHYFLPMKVGRAGKARGLKPQVLEYDLWTMLRGGDRGYGMGTVSEKTIEELRQLSHDCEGWHDRNSVVPLPEWKAKFAKWWRDEHLPALRNHLQFLRREVGKADFIGRLTTEQDVAIAEAKLLEAERQLPEIEADR